MGGPLGEQQGQQAFFSLSSGFGAYTTFGARTSWDTPVCQLAVAIPVLDFVMSVLAACLVFSLAGVVHATEGADMSNLDKSGVRLAFEVFPAALAQMPQPLAWIIPSFLTMALMGLGSLLGLTQTAVDTLEFWRSRMKFWGNQNLTLAFVCAMSFGLGIFLMCRGGIYYMRSAESLVAVGLFSVLMVQTLGHICSPEARREIRTLRFRIGDSAEDTRSQLKSCTWYSLLVLLVIACVCLGVLFVIACIVLVRSDFAKLTCNMSGTQITQGCRRFSSHIRYFWILQRFSLSLYCLFSRLSHCVVPRKRLQKQALRGWLGAKKTKEELRQGLRA
uniref:Transmembrane protein n=1 Tax=Chromera velia CCMP2878 TaxID=1169474 RepID=A0A0G4GFC7_9ALVE|eukprot:Cvel_21652.t1-p1 / transcript=Cvel_21652.t1 / gene=Cvel_21652 / organism=Chromera_velia_CCMP2878 / gene_product=Creatine transporter, putative / transcript_product=Creatine transporter, putative / location=Cvel_scaffold2048:17132-18194(-) / protein_length=331 / sequence_SO=supercontig / SO=protein_coding / is_pseudo=false